MWPWAHAAVGYLCYTLYLRARRRETPTGEAAILLGVGTQLPDLIDKPFAWYVDVLPYGRSFAHSLVTGVPFVLVPVVVALDRRGRRDLAVAVTIGYLSHIAGDGYLAVLRGQWADLGYLVWPIVAPPATETEGLLAHLSDITAEPRFLFGFGLAAIGLAVWVRHGTPGVGTLRAWLDRRARTG